MNNDSSLVYQQATRRYPAELEALGQPVMMQYVHINLSNLTSDMTTAAVQEPTNNAWSDESSPTIEPDAASQFKRKQVWDLILLLGLLLSTNDRLPQQNKHPSTDHKHGTSANRVGHLPAHPPEQGTEQQRSSRASNLSPTPQLP